MRVLLIRVRAPVQLPYYFITDYVGLGYLASCLRQEGHSVQILDGQILNIGSAQMAAEIGRRCFDVLGLSIMDYTMIHPVIETLSAWRRLAGDSQRCRVFLGGNFATLHHGRLLELTSADGVILYEAEQTFPEVVSKIEQGVEWRDVPGVVHREAKPQDHSAAHTHSAINLDELPFPARDTVPDLLTLYPNAMVSMLASRGCWQHCSFCTVRTYFGLWRHRTAEKVVDELESLHNIYGARWFEFQDDNFIGPGLKGRERARELSCSIRDRGLGIKFRFLASADSIELDTVKALRDAGAYGVFMGIESGIQRAMDSFNKRIRVEQNAKALQVLDELDLLYKSKIGFIMFDPQTTFDEVLANIEFLRKNVKYLSPVCFTNILEDFASSEYLDSPETAVHSKLLAVKRLPYEIKLLYGIVQLINAHLMPVYRGIILLRNEKEKQLLHEWSLCMAALVEDATNEMRRLVEGGSRSLIDRLYGSVLCDFNSRAARVADELVCRFNLSMGYPNSIGGAAISEESLIAKA